MLEPRGVRGGRLDRSGGKLPLSRRSAPRRLHRDEKLIYAGRVGTGIDTAELEGAPAAAARHHTNTARCAAAPRGARFGLPLVLSRAHWVRPELVVEVKFLAWTEDNLLRQAVYEGPREESNDRV